MPSLSKADVGAVRFTPVSRVDEIGFVYVSVTGDLSLREASAPPPAPSTEVGVFPTSESIVLNSGTPEFSGEGSRLAFDRISWRRYTKP